MSRFKEPVIWAMIVIVCILAIVLLLRYKDKIDGYGKKEWQETSAFKPTPGPWQDMKGR